MTACKGLQYRLFQLCLVGGSLLALATVATAQQLRPITLSFSSTSFATAVPRIAKELGIFEKHGIDAKFVIMDSANAATTALIAKSVDGAVSGPGELVVAQARGQKVVVVANGYAGLSSSVVISKAVADKLGVAPNAPVKDRLKALDGLLIGSVSATSAVTVALRGATKGAGAEIRFTYLSQPAYPAGIESGNIQGAIGGAPFWAIPVVKGTGVLWLSGPKGELPPENTPRSSIALQVMRDFAEANRPLMASLAAVFADVIKAIDERPAEVRAAVAKLYPDLDAPTLELIIASESQGWKAKPLTAEDMAHEIAFVKANGAPLPGLDAIDPASLIFK